MKMFVLFIFILISNVTASESQRISDELDSDGSYVPLKISIGEKLYDEAMESGKYRYVGNSKCRLCHRKFFIGRKKDLHDHSMDSLIKSGHEKNPKCLSCHSTGYGTPTGFESMERTPRLANVQCEGCHGPGNEHIRLIKAKKHGGFLAGTDNPQRIRNMCINCHTERWNKSYHDLNEAYDKYKRASPNSKKGYK